MKRHTKAQTIGDYWTIDFDSNPKVMQELEARLRQDPTVLRWTTLKLGSRLMECVEKPVQTEQATFKELKEFRQAIADRSFL
ncbi:hypothetical protein FRB91_009044 [Serendipita sp. 411]|nr:hypothetical protein FRC18_006165 [Serendipita sp. 400]KAG8858912.1 hypothetical protein FRB91_009044 [Serendipita sp. 411]